MYLHTIILEDLFLSMQICMPKCSVMYVSPPRDWFESIEPSL